MGSRAKLEVELANRLGAERAAAIVRELGRDIVTNPIIERSPAVAAEAVARIARMRGSVASAHEIAAEFVQRMLDLL